MASFIDVNILKNKKDNNSMVSLTKRTCSLKKPVF